MFIIFMLVNPKFLKIFSSFLSIISEKKYSVAIKNINGNISNRIEGEFNIVKKIGRLTLILSTFLKKLNSSKIFKIIVIQKKTKVTIKRDLKKELIIYFW